MTSVLDKIWEVISGGIFTLEIADMRSRSQTPSVIITNYQWSPGTTDALLIGLLPNFCLN